MLQNRMWKWKMAEDMALKSDEVRRLEPTPWEWADHLARFLHRIVEMCKARVTMSGTVGSL